MPQSPPVACRICGRAECDCKPAEQGHQRKTFHDIHKHLYDAARWRNKNYGLRACIMRRDPVCVLCHREATEVVDHIIDHRGDPKLFYDPRNLRGLCKGCHDSRTGTEHGSGNRSPDKPGLLDGRVVEYMDFTPVKQRHEPTRPAGVPTETGPGDAATTDQG